VKKNYALSPESSEVGHLSWQRVRGHDAIVEGFDRLVRRGRLGHAYLFTGPAGIGKRLFAEELAKALLCERTNGERLEACDRCPACKQMEAGTHPDFMIARRPDDSLDLPIEAIRELGRSLGLKPARGRGKVAIVDDADDFNTEAANCFLKTLEEPPPRSVFLLVATNPDLQLPTIVSRCQIVRFYPLAEPAVMDLIRARGVDDSQLAERLARLSNGSPGRALSLTDPGLWVFRRRLIDAVSQPRFDSISLARDWAQFAEDAGKESALQRRRVSLSLDFLIEFFEEALILSVGGTPRVVDKEDFPAVKKLVERTTPEMLMQLLERSLEANTHIDRRVALVLILESLADALASKLN
jgi:DNA polymerase III subunit delta'